MNSRSVNPAYFYLIVTFALWGSTYVLSKYLMSSIPPAMIALLRYGLAVIPLTVILTRRHMWVKVAAQDRWLLFKAGFFGYYLTITLNVTAVSLCGASMTALINSLTPVIMTVMGMLFLKEKLDRIKLLCLALALAGTLTITIGSFNSVQHLGVGMIMIALVSWSYTAVLVRKLSASYDPLVITTYGMLISLIFHCPTALISTLRAGGMRLDITSILVLCYMAFIGASVGQWTWSKALSLLEAGSCSLLYPLQVFFSVLLGALILDERVGPRFYIGTALIAADVAINWWHTDRRRRDQPNTGPWRETDRKDGCADADEAGLRAGPAV